MKEICLTRGQVALVDDDWFKYLSQWKWYAKRDNKNGRFYAYRNSRVGEFPKRRSIQMHRVITKFPKPRQVDHQDGNGCNNQRNNLRIASFSQNQWNAKIRKDNSTGFKGVSRRKRRAGYTYSAFIQVKNKRINLGYFKTPQEASHARLLAAEKHHGKFMHS